MGDTPSALCPLSQTHGSRDWCVWRPAATRNKRGWLRNNAKGYPMPVQPLRSRRMISDLDKQAKHDFAAESIDRANASGDVFFRWIAS
jgi:hypothetical protein